jgi:hypothetical protein
VVSTTTVGESVLTETRRVQMRLTHTVTLAAIAASTLTTTAVAGGLEVEVIEPQLIEVEEVQPRSSWGIILPIAAVALLIALAGS